MHLHIDYNNHTCFLITLYHNVTSGGNIKYYKEKPQNKGNETSYHVTICKQGCYQTRPYNKVNHSVSEWQGDSGVISFFLFKKMLQCFCQPGISNDSHSKNTTKTKLDKKIKLVKEKLNRRIEFTIDQKNYIQGIFKDILS